MPTCGWRRRKTRGSRPAHQALRRGRRTGGGCGRTAAGQVTFDDVIDVVEEEQTEDISASVASRPMRNWGPMDHRCGAGSMALRQSVHRLHGRRSGLLFKDTVTRTVALAVWMPIIAGMGGNAGTQALAVTVRRLALGLIPPDRFFGSGRRFSSDWSTGLRSRHGIGRCRRDGEGS
jgi:magnesium transporter